MSIGRIAEWWQKTRVHRMWSTHIMPALVIFALTTGILAATANWLVSAFSIASNPRAEDPTPLVKAWPDGRIKMYVTSRLLQFRRAHPALFSEGESRYLSTS